MDLTWEPARALDHVETMLSRLEQGTPPEALSPLLGVETILYRASPPVPVNWVLPALMDQITRAEEAPVPTPSPLTRTWSGMVLLSEPSGEWLIEGVGAAPLRGIAWATWDPNATTVAVPLVRGDAVAQEWPLAQGCPLWPVGAVSADAPDLDEQDQRLLRLATLLGEAVHRDEAWAHLVERAEVSWPSDSSMDGEPWPGKPPTVVTWDATTGVEPWAAVTEGLERRAAALRAARPLPSDEMVLAGLSRGSGWVTLAQAVKAVKRSGARTSTADVTFVLEGLVKRGVVVTSDGSYRRA